MAMELKAQTRTVAKRTPENGMPHLDKIAGGQ
jgi:hypothetical protein